MSFFNSSEGRQNIRVVQLCEWLDWAAGNCPDEWHVELPMIQRGFVWKPNQILELWDTLLQGLPIGALLISELEGAVSVPLSGQQRTEGSGAGRLGLVDGQQRTLAMLAGWPMQAESSHRVWVDFADEPRGGELLRLCITTRNQPFGFSRDNPNAKLSQSDRKKALDSWKSTVQGKNDKAEASLPDFQHTLPWSNKPSLPMDMRQLVRLWRESKHDASAWKQAVLQQLQVIRHATNGGGNAASVGPELPPVVIQRLDRLAEGLKLIDAAQIPLLRVDKRLFERDDDRDNKTTEPPLALLFKRIGSNATPLTNDDYVYAILKHLLPDVHGMVTQLHAYRSGGHEHASVASLLSATDLAMSALRLAAASRKSGDKEQAGDPESPSKEDFHRLINKRDGFLNDSFLPILTTGAMQGWFRSVMACLEYRGVDDKREIVDSYINDPGLPRHAMPHLSRPLVQVLLRLAQIGYLDTDIDTARRSDVLRLVLYWWVCVHDHHKASRVAYRVLANADGKNSSPNLGQKIMEAIIKEAACYKLPDIKWIESRFSTESANSGKVRGWLRFTPKADDDTDRLLCAFWQRWWSPSTHRHPILLWLQRSYVARMAGDPIAGRDEDTPYDYDHILPINHWGQWTGVTGNRRFIDHCHDSKQAYVVGNSIGNIRVWASSDNRSDGAASPSQKLQLTSSTDGAEQAASNVWQQEPAQLLRDSAIDEEQISHWADCSQPDGADNRDWDLRRARSFEKAVEQRALTLYRRFFVEPDFQAWASQEAFLQQRP